MKISERLKLLPEDNEKRPLFDLYQTIIRFLSVAFLCHVYSTEGPYIFVALMIAPWLIGVVLLYARDKVIKSVRKIFCSCLRQKPSSDFVS